MKLAAPVALLLAVVAYVFLVLTFMNLLSGSLEERSCASDCVKNYYLIAAGTGLLGFLAALGAFFSSGFRGVGLFALVVAFPPAAVVTGLFVIGNYGDLLH